MPFRVAIPNSVTKPTSAGVDTDPARLAAVEERRADLAQSVRICNQAVADHLASLRALNQASQAGR